MVVIQVKFDGLLAWQWRVVKRVAMLERLAENCLPIPTPNRLVRVTRAVQILGLPVRIVVKQDKLHPLNLSIYQLPNGGVNRLRSKADSPAIAVNTNADCSVARGLA